MEWFSAQVISKKFFSESRDYNSCWKFQKSCAFIGLQKNDYETAKSENIGTDFIITWEFSVTFHQNIVQHFEMFGNTAIFGIQRGHMMLTVHHLNASGQYVSREVPGA